MSKGSSQTYSLIEEHKSLMELVDRLQQDVRRRAYGDMSNALAEVRQHTLVHFRLEEADGYMQPVLQQKPHFERKIQKLLRDHRTLSAALDAIIDDLGPTADFDSLAERIESWISLIHHHEREENMLVEDAFTSDIGTKD